MKIINSLENKTIKSIIKLKESRERKKRAEFLVDGLREIKLALNSDYKASLLVFCPSLVKIEKKELEEVLRGFLGKGGREDGKNDGEAFEIIEVSESIFKKISYKESPDGFLGIFKFKELGLEELVVDKKPIIILESLEKPGNLGAIIRTASAGGLENIILNDCLFDIYNPNVIKASEGLIFFVNIFKLKKEETLEFLKREEIKTFIALTSAKKSYDKFNFSKNSAIILGSEANGLSDFWIKNADERLKIPMREGVDSLNVSVSAGILIYEALRQGGFKGLE